MVLIDSVAPSRTRNTTCNCQHNANDHYLVRCGCLNDRPSSHPMHINDDAFHHTWCHICRIYCYKDAVCPNDLPDTHAVRLLFTFCIPDVSFCIGTARSLSPSMLEYTRNLVQASDSGFKRRSSPPLCQNKRTSRRNTSGPQQKDFSFTKTFRCS
jgi:hypothetical protein